MLPNEEKLITPSFAMPVQERSASTPWMAFAALQPLLTGAQVAFKNYQDTKDVKDALCVFL